MPPSLPAAFRYAGVSCGIKQANVEDLTLIVADEECVAAGVYTQNLVFAAPVGIDRQRTPSDRIRAVVVNSGNANACTGPRGWDDALQMGRLAADAIGAAEEQVLVMSTGVIGEFLPMDKIAAGIERCATQLDRSQAAFDAAARGILTTDQGTKTAAADVSLGDGNATIRGMAKGAGMIGPRMATLLGVVLTDARLTPATAQELLAEAVNQSFNRISVEGHMSTNDTILLLASGRAVNEPLAGDALQAFATSLTDVCVELAKQIPADGEGASHLMQIAVLGCRTTQEAERIAKTVADSALVKTAITGNDPNWGRIVSAVGYAGVELDPAKLDLSINDTRIYEAGAPTMFADAEVSRSMAADFTVRLDIHLHSGSAEAVFWSSDLTCDYVRFNSDYRT